MMKRFVCLFLSFVMLFGLCACGDVTTQSTEPNSTQANITATSGTESTTVPATEATEATTMPTAEATTEPTIEATIATSAESQEEMVWIPTKGGTKYHTKASCSNMIDPEQVTQAEAESRNFTPCKKCH